MSETLNQNPNDHNQVPTGWEELEQQRYEHRLAEMQKTSKGTYSRADVMDTKRQEGESTEAWAARIREAHKDDPEFAGERNLNSKTGKERSHDDKTGGFTLFDKYPRLPDETPEEYGQRLHFIIEKTRQFQAEHPESKPEEFGSDSESDAESDAESGSDTGINPSDIHNPDSSAAPGADSSGVPGADSGDAPDADPADAPDDDMDAVAPDNRDYENYPEPELEELKIAVVNQDDERETRARFHGENEMSRELERAKGLGKLALKFWKHGIAKNFFRQRAINKARREIQSKEKLYLDASDEEYREYRDNLCRTYLSEADEAIAKDQGDQRESLKETNPELHEQIKNLIERYASREIDNREDLRMQFNEIMQQVADGRFSNRGGHLNASNVEAIAIKARQNFENLATVAEAVNSEFDHAESMARVMRGFDLLYGKRNTDRLDPHYNKVDKAIDKIMGSKVGCLVSRESVALAVGAVAGVASFAGKRTLRSACVVPGLGAAIWGAAEAGVAFEDDRARAQVDMRYNHEFDGNQKLRKKVNETLYTFRSSNEVAGDLNGQIEAINEQLSEGETIAPERLQDLLNLTARTEWYLRQERTENPVLKYTSEIKAPEEQLRLINILVSAKKLLREQGVADLDERLNAESELMQSVDSSLSEDVNRAKRRAKEAKVGAMAKKFGFGLASGIAVGFIAQEVSALFNPNVQGLFEDGSHDNMGARLTAGCKLAQRFGLKNNEPDFTGSRLIQAGVTVSEQSKDLGEVNFERSQDGTFSVTYNGKNIAQDLDWNSETGELTDESIQKLSAQGIKITKSGSILMKVPDQTTSVQTDYISAEQLKQYVGSNNVVNAHRAFWWENNTPLPDQNELAGHYYTDPDTGLRGLVTSMTNTGSSHGGETANFSELAQAGKIKLFISLTKGSQSTPVEVTGKLLDNGQVAFIPEPGSASAACFDESGKFIGKFAEIAQVIEENGNDITYAPLATAVGRGLTGEVPILNEVIENTVKKIDIPQYVMSVTEQIETPEYVVEEIAREVDIPLILPFSLGSAMNSSKMRHIEDGDGTYSIPSREGYGYGYYGNSGSSERRISYGDWEAAFGEYVSPRVKEGRELELREELGWYSQQMEAKKGPEYMDRARSAVESSEELRNLGENTRTIITIPVHGPSEFDNIYHTLSTYAGQEGVDFSTMPIVLDINWRATEKYSADELRDRVQKTYDEIARARRDFPELRIATFEQVGHSGIHEVSDFMNSVVMAAIEKAISEGRMSEDNDVLIIRNDADVKHVSKNYVSSYQKAMDENPKTPLFTGTTFFDIERTHQTPGFGAVLTIDRMDNLLGAVEGTSIHTAGANFAFRAAHFAATSGGEFAPDEEWLNSGTAGYDDLKVGYNLENAFSYAYGQRRKKSGNPEDRDLMDPDTRMLVRVGGASIDTDDVRYLTPYAADTANVLDDAYDGSFNLRPDAAAVAKFQEKIMDKQQFNGVVEQFEREMSARFSRGGDYRLRRVLDWWFGGDSEGLYTIEGEGYDTGHQHQREFSRYFALTDEGKQRLRSSILSRIGDGISSDVRNTMQRAIVDGEWI